MTSDTDEGSASMLLLQAMDEPDKDFSVKVSEVAYTRAERAVLREIIYWFPKAKTIRNGEVWLIKSAMELQEADIDFALSTIRKAVRALVKRGVIRTERHFHPYRAICGPVYFIRPAKEVIDDFSKTKRSMAPW